MKERLESQKGPRRSDWLFVYSIKRLLEGAEYKLHYHKDRVSYWELEREKAVQAVKSAGFEVREYEVTGGKDVQVVVDPTLNSRLSTCSSKIREHQKHIKDYTQWIAVLKTQNLEEKVDLHIDDVLYFGIAYEKPNDGE